MDTGLLPRGQEGTNKVDSIVLWRNSVDRCKQDKDETQERDWQELAEEIYGIHEKKPHASALGWKATKAIEYNNKEE